MQIKIEISDEHIHQTSNTPASTITMDSTALATYVASDAISGGVGPTLLAGTVLNTSQTSQDVVSAGAAEQHLVSSLQSAASQADFDGGSAPS